MASPQDFPQDPPLTSGALILFTSPAVSGSVESGRIGMLDGTDQVNPSPDMSAQTGTKSRKRRVPRYDWLPPGWTFEEKVRTNGTTAGLVDKYYYEPVTDRKFRSKIDVLYYLKHGTTRKGTKKADDTDFHSVRVEGQGSHTQAPPPPLNFDFENPPEKVSWSMENTGEDQAWTAFIGDDKVQDSLRQDWNMAFTVVTIQNPSNQSF